MEMEWGASRGGGDADVMLQTTKNKTVAQAMERNYAVRVR